MLEPLVGQESQTKGYSFSLSPPLLPAAFLWITVEDASGHQAGSVKEADIF